MTNRILWRKARCKLFCFLAIALLTLPALNPLLADVLAEDVKLLASDAAPGDALGFSVDIEGDTAIVGAYRSDAKGPDSGAAYIFVRDGGAWVQQAKLTPADGVGGDWFGLAVAINKAQDTVVVSSYYDEDLGPRSGSAYVFIRQGSTWSQQAKLTASDGQSWDYFGGNVAIYEDTIVVGAVGKNNWQGAAYVFVRNGTSWSQQAKLTSSDGAAIEYFGEAVSIESNTAAVGAFRGDNYGNNPGVVYVFSRSGTSWSQQNKLVPSDGVAGDGFGISVSQSGDTLAIGAFWDDDNGTNSGSVYVYTRDGGSWNFQDKLTASDGAAGDYFGDGVALDGDTLAVTAVAADNWTGSSYVFARNGTAWAERARLVPNDLASQDEFGHWIALSGDTVLVGAMYHDAAGTNAGAAYIFSISAPLFSCMGFDDPLQNGPVTVRGNRALPLKANVLDADGYEVSDWTIAASPVVQVWYEYGTPDQEPIEIDALPAGQGDDGNQFAYSGSKWQFNLSTKNYSAPGTYTIFMDSGDGSEYTFDEPTCTAEFVIE